MTGSGYAPNWDPGDGTIDGIETLLGNALLRMIKILERGPSTTKTKRGPVSDQTVLLRPIPGSLVLVQVLGQTEHFAVITVPGEAGVTVFFVCYTAVKHRKAALHSPRTASQAQGWQ